MVLSMDFVIKQTRLTRKYGEATGLLSEAVQEWRVGQMTSIITFIFLLINNNQHYPALTAYKAAWNTLCLSSLPAAFENGTIMTRVS